MNKKKIVIGGLALLVVGGAISACGAKAISQVEPHVISDVVSVSQEQDIPPSLPLGPSSDLYLDDGVETEGSRTIEADEISLEEAEPEETVVDSSEVDETTESVPNEAESQNPSSSQEQSNNSGNNSDSGSNNDNKGGGSNNNGGSNNSSNPPGTVAGAKYVGNFSIPAVGVSVPCYASSSQAVCDAQNAAAYFYMSNHLVIADHVNQGFNKIKSCSPGMVAYAPDGTKYECITIMQGVNTGYSLTLTDGTNIREIYPGAMVAYTCNSNWQSVTMVFFKVYGTNIEDPSEEFEEDNDFYPGENPDKVPCSPGTHQWDLVDSFEYWHVVGNTRTKMLREVFICSVCEGELYKETEIVESPEETAPEEPPIEEVPSEPTSPPTEPPVEETTPPEQEAPSEPEIPEETEPSQPIETPSEPPVETEPPVISTEPPSQVPTEDVGGEFENEDVLKETEN